MNSKPASHFKEWAVVLGLTVAYWWGTPFLVQVFGVGIVSLGVLPVAVAGWYFGIPGGVISSLLIITLSSIMVTNLDGYPWDNMHVSGFITGAGIMLFVGIIMGRLRQVLEARLRTETQLRSREHYLMLLNQMTHDISASQSFDDLLKKLTRDMANLLDADACFITRWDESLKKTIPLAGSVELEQPYHKLELAPGELTLTRSVIDSGRVLAVEDVYASPYISPSVAQKFSAISMLGIPLIFQDRKLGALIADFNTAHKFNAEEITRAEQAGDQVSLLLWNAQQDLELSQRLRESLTLKKIAQALIETEHVGLGTILQLIANSARELLPATEQAVIHLLDDKQQFLIPQAVSGFDVSAADGMLNLRPNEGVAGQVIVSGETINIADVHADVRFLLMENSKPAFRSLMVAAVQTSAKKLGTISVQSRQVNAFTEDESRLLGSLGTQAAIAIENAHLLESTQQALKETNALYSINQELVATLDPQELMQDVVELLQKNFGYSYVQICVADQQSGDFVMRAGSGEIGRKLREQDYRLLAGEGIVGYTAETGDSFFTNNVDEMVSFVRNPLLPDTKSELAVPVKIDGHILGLLDIHQAPPAFLSQRDLQLVSAVADQLALALQKANLYTDLQNSLQTEKNIRNQLLQADRLSAMGRLLASVSHELNNPLQAIQNALFLLREETGISPQGKQDLDIVLSESERMAALIARLRTTYRPIQIEDFQPMQINDVIEDVYALIATHLRHNEIVFEFFPDPNLPIIPGLTDQIRQVILNLLMNAVEAMANGGRLTVFTHFLEENGEVLLSVSDTGTGIDPAILPAIFDAFVTNKERGTGLGLTITYDIISKHHGRIQAENNSEHGATFNVWFPIKELGSE
jgi:signal transduction histidine kinase